MNLFIWLEGLLCAGLIKWNCVTNRISVFTYFMDIFCLTMQFWVNILF